MARRPSYLSPSEYQPRGRAHPRTHAKRIAGRGGITADGEIIIFIYQNIGMQRFTYADARDMMVNRAEIQLPQTKLGSFVGWGWLIKVGHTVENKPRLIYQVPKEMQNRLESIISGEKIARTNRQTY